MPAPSSEPREWAECPYCRAGDWNRRAADEDAFMPCPECGQPPRCQAGSKTDRHCARAGTVQPFGDCGFTVCGQHYREQSLSCEESEWEIARDYVVGFAKIAEVVDIEPLNRIIDLAWGECEMRLSVLEAERAMVWGEQED